MFLWKGYNKKMGRTYLSIVHSYRHKTTKKTRFITIISDINGWYNNILHEHFFKNQVQEPFDLSNKELDEKKL